MDDDHRGGTGAIAMLVLPNLAATVVFNLTRGYDEGRPIAVGSLVHVDGGRATLGVPVVLPDPRSTQLVLASGSF